MDKFDDILSYACSRWNNSIVICGDINFDLSKLNQPIQKCYLSILSSHYLSQHIKKPTRKIAILDRIITNSITKIKNVNVIPCPEVSDHDVPYITLSNKFAPFEPRYKIIFNMKNIRQQDFIDLFTTPRLGLAYAFNDPNDMISVFNELISNHINEHAPLKTIRVTRPTALWMNDIDIVDLKQKCHQLRTLCHTTNRETDWNDLQYLICNDLLEINLKLKLKERSRIFIVKHYLVINLVKFGKLSIQMLNAFELIQMNLISILVLHQDD